MKPKYVAIGLAIVYTIVITAYLTAITHDLILIAKADPIFGILIGWASAVAQLSGIFVMVFLYGMEKSTKAKVKQE